MAENGRFLETCSAIVDQRQPEVFADFLSANEAEREMMEVRLHSTCIDSALMSDICAQAQFKLIKNYFRLEVRNEWYEYRCGVYGNGEGSVNDALRRNLQHLEQVRVSSVLRRHRCETARRTASSYARRALNLPSSFRLFDNEKPNLRGTSRPNERGKRSSKDAIKSIS